MEIKPKQMLTDWKLVRNKIYDVLSLVDGRGNGIADFYCETGDGSGSLTPFPNAEANAAFIVRACNSWAMNNKEMIEATKAEAEGK